MFDPTAYENFKIIIEGSVYDADFTGDIIVVNRAELIDLSILSRRFEIQFELKNNNHTTASIIVCSSLDQLAAEILSQDEKNAGAKIEIHFYSKLNHEPSSNEIENITSTLLNIWGKERLIHSSISQHFQNGVQTHYTCKSIVSFNRIVTEEQAEDLYEIVNYGIRSLELLTKRV